MVLGGTEHTWTTVRADGSKKTESKTVYDTVELSGSEEEYEEYEEEYETEEDEEEVAAPAKTVTTKAQAPSTVKGKKWLEGKNKF